MLFTDSVFVGVDPTSGRKSFTYAALDTDLNLISLADGEMEDVTAYLGGQQNAAVALNAPLRVNRGLVREKMKREMLTPHQIRGAELRVSEFELRERGISVSGTPASVALCPSWAQMGFELLSRLRKIGFREFPQINAPLQVMETHPHACYCVLVGSVPLPKSSLEGRLQRQLILHEQGVRIKDPMDFFEEITRYKLAKGIWPVDLLYLSEQLDAMVAAYTAWLAVKKPEKITLLGIRKRDLLLCRRMY